MDGYGFIAYGHAAPELLLHGLRVHRVPYALVTRPPLLTVSLLLCVRLDHSSDQTTPTSCSSDDAHC